MTNKDTKVIETTDINASSVTNTIKKKRGRKPKKLLEQNKNEVINENVIVKPKRKYTKRKNVEKNKVETPTNENTKQEEPVIKQPKKRGRKPKGGKIIVEETKLDEINTQTKPNVILHLKCSSKPNTTQFIGDLNYNPNIEPITAYNENEMDNYNKIEYSVEVSMEQFENNKNIIQEHTDGKTNNNGDIITSNIDINNTNNTSNKLLWEKLKQLQYILHNDDISDKKSKCFSCSHSFNTPTIYIPMYEFDGKYKVYGCFCLPECACRYLFNENIDTSIKWERYALLNNMYGRIFNYEKPIKPAPSPYYLLNDYYGNLTIEEYRKMLQTDKLILVVDKPMSRVLPEIHDENNENPIFNYNKNISNGKVNNINSSKKYKLSRNKPTIHKKNKDMWANV